MRRPCYCELAKLDNLKMVKEEGEKLGREKGKIEALFDVALNLLHLGLTIEQISQTIGLCVAEVEIIKIERKIRKRSWLILMFLKND